MLEVLEFVKMGMHSLSNYEETTGENDYIKGSRQIRF